jgi:hypothetical protein
MRKNESNIETLSKLALTSLMKVGRPSEESVDIYLAAVNECNIQASSRELLIGLLEGAIDAVNLTLDILQKPSE